MSLRTYHSDCYCLSQIILEAKAFWLKTKEKIKVCHETLSFWVRNIAASEIQFSISFHRYILTNSHKEECLSSEGRAPVLRKVTHIT